MYVCSKPTDTELTRRFNPIKKKMELFRLSLATETVIPIPEPPNEFKGREEGLLDTPKDIVAQVTWQPSLDQCPFPVPFMNELERMRRKNREAQAL